MNDNVGDMPLEIFSDYSSDMLDEEWNWEYFTPAINALGSHGTGHGYGMGHGERVSGIGCYNGLIGSCHTILNLNGLGHGFNHDNGFGYFTCGNGSSNHGVG